MLPFLFEQYGYYPNLQDNRFFIEGWEFRLIEVDCDEEFVEIIEKYNNVIRENFDGRGVHILKTRYNQKISCYDNKKFVLMSAYRSEVNISDFNKLHLLFNEHYKSVDLKELLNLWQTRMTTLENEGIQSLRIDGNYYSDNLEKSMFAFGLCQNAIQYLSELIDDYGSIVDNVTITHGRIKRMDAFDFFNPFNFVFDHPIRDFAELYKNNVIDFTNLISIFEYYRLDAKIATLFVARLLYPSEVLDALEDNLEEKEKTFKINYFPEKELLKIKKAYLYFKDKYNIRPIYWLEIN